jgi:hypothetical protein
VSQIPSHSMTQGKAAAPVGVTITDDRAMSPVMVPARFPNHRPMVRFGVPVVEYSPFAVMLSLEPRRSFPPGTTGSGDGDTSCLVVNVFFAVPTAVWNGETGSHR